MPEPKPRIREVIVVEGVQMYANKGKVLLYDNSATEAYTEADLVKDANGVYKTPEGYDVYITIRDNLKWLGGYALIDYVSAYGELYFGMEAFHALAAMADGNVPHPAYPAAALPCLLRSL